MTVFVEQFYVGDGSNFTVAVKDNIDVDGYVTTAGSEAYSKNKTANKNATVVNRVLKAGCRLIGKLNMHELAFGMTGVNSFLGTPVNYLYPYYIPGGSSSGCAAAVAENKVDFSIGTDTGGSIRVPAACCGVFGLKPTFGRISKKGTIPAESTLDCVGPLATSANKIIKAMEIIDESFHLTSLPKSISLGQIKAEADSSILALIDKALDKEFLNTTKINALPSFEKAFDAALVIMNAEMWSSFGYLLQVGKLGEDIKQRLSASKNISKEAIAEAENIRKTFTEEVDKALANFDALVLPTLASFPLSREAALAGKSDLTISSLTRPFNLSGHPAITIPLSNDLGKPVAMQIIGAKGKDELICQIAGKISESSNEYNTNIGE